MSKNDKKSTAEWQKRLTPEQFRITRMKGTERPFTGEYNDCKESGIYRCVCCSNPLFRSEAKYDSGSGWPSFFEPIGQDSLRFVSDDSMGMHRMEVVCSRCDAHLGHVFDDGPQPTGKRFCMNSVALDLDAET